MTRLHPAESQISPPTNERSRLLGKNEDSYKRKYGQLLDTIPGHEEEKELLEPQERDNRANSRAEKRLMVVHLKTVECANSASRSRRSRRTDRSRNWRRSDKPQYALLEKQPTLPAVTVDAPSPATSIVSHHLPIQLFRLLPLTMYVNARLPIPLNVPGWSTPSTVCIQRRRPLQCWLLKIWIQVQFRGQIELIDP